MPAAFAMPVPHSLPWLSHTLSDTSDFLPVRVTCLALTVSIIVLLSGGV